MLTRKKKKKQVTKQYAQHNLIIVNNQKDKDLEYALM